MICDRCEESFDESEIEEVKYVVTCSDGSIEYTTKYCKECALICERDIEEMRND